MSLNRSFWWLHYAHATRLWCASTYSSNSSLATLSFVFKMCGRSGLKTSAMVGNGRLFWCCCYHCRCSWASEITTSSICRCTCKFSAQTTSGSTVPSCIYIYIRVVAQTNVVWLPNVTERSVAMSWISLFHNPVTEICVDLAPRWRNACCTCRRSRTFLLRWGKWVQTVHLRAQDSSVSKI